MSCLHAAAIAVLALLTFGPARAEPPAAAAPAATTPAVPLAGPPPIAPGLPDPPIPTQHAVQAGIGRCVPAVDQLSRVVFRNPYNAQSTWSQTNPADHVFQMVAGVKSPKPEALGGMVAIVTAPVPTEACDAVAMEVQPLASNCADVRKMMKDGEGETSLEGMLVVTDPQKRRLMLLPGAGNTCVVISVTSFYGAKAAEK